MSSCFAASVPAGQRNPAVRGVRMFPPVSGGWVTHLIDVNALRENDFERFYEYRSRQLIALVEAAMGKNTLSRESEQR